jgi:exopolysaccharide production protein ExoZ
VFQSLQICRAVAALLVVLFHLSGAIGSDKYFNWPELQHAFVFGHSGVAFFFVLSGFIIAYVHGADLGQPSRLQAYTYKRLLRIYPPFLIVFGVVFIAAWASSSTRSTLPTDWSVLLKALLLVPQDPAIVGGTGAPVLIVAWSLHYEVFFYAVFGLAILSRAAGLAALVALMVNRLLCWSEPACTFVQSFLASHWLLLFLMGAAIAWFVAKRRPLAHPIWTLAIGIFGFVVVAATEVAGTRFQPAVLYLAYGVFSSLTVLGAVSAERGGPGDGAHPAVAALGDSSYALYLLHYPLISLLCKLAMAFGLSGRGGASISFVAILIVCVFGAHVFHRRVEKPLLAALHRRLIRPADARRSHAL